MIPDRGEIPYRKLRKDANGGQDKGERREARLSLFLLLLLHRPGFRTKTLLEFEVTRLGGPVDGPRLVTFGRLIYDDLLHRRRRAVGAGGGTRGERYVEQGRSRRQKDAENGFGNGFRSVPAHTLLFYTQLAEHQNTFRPRT